MSSGKHTVQYAASLIFQNQACLAYLVAYAKHQILQLLQRTSDVISVSLLNQIVVADALLSRLLIIIKINCRRKF